MPRFIEMDERTPLAAQMGAARAVSGKHHGFAPSVQEGGGAPYLHRLSTLSRDSWTYDGWPSDAGES
jgi:hypothetical protein